MAGDPIEGQDFGAFSLTVLFVFIIHFINAERIFTRTKDNLAGFREKQVGTAHVALESGLQFDKVDCAL